MTTDMDLSNQVVAITGASSGIGEATARAFVERAHAVPLGVRVTLIEPGAVATELAAHNRPEVLVRPSGQAG